MEHISQEHNLRDIREYDAYCALYVNKEKKQNQATVKQENILAGSAGGGAIATEHEKGTIHI